MYIRQGVCGVVGAMMALRYPAFVCDVGGVGDMMWYIYIYMLGYVWWCWCYDVVYIPNMCCCRWLCYDVVYILYVGRVVVGDMMACIYLVVCVVSSLMWRGVYITGC